MRAGPLGKYFSPLYHHAPATTATNTLCSHGLSTEAWTTPVMPAVISAGLEARWDSVRSVSADRAQRGTYTGVVKRLIALKSLGQLYVGTACIAFPCLARANPLDRSEADSKEFGEPFMTLTAGKHHCNVVIAEFVHEVMIPRRRHSRRHDTRH